MDDDNDKTLWQQITEYITPLKQRKRNVKLPPKIQKIHRQDKKPPIVPRPIKNRSFQHLQVNDFSRVDSTIAKKLRKGLYHIDRTLDLHGNTQNEAFDKLYNLILNAYNQKLRCLLVITGKGFGGHGVLRNEMNKWMNNDEINKYILVYTYACNKHGGEGAFYVLLRQEK